MVEQELVRKKRILVAESDERIALDLGRRLERFGYEVAGLVAYAEGVLYKARELRPDLILSEARLAGGGDGIRAADEVRDALGIPVILLSSFSDSATLDRAIAFGPSALLLKPFKEGDLRSSLFLALESRSWGSAASQESDVETNEVLIVEDEKIIALDLQRRLERLGFPVVGIAADSWEALSMARRLRPSLVITGIDLGSGSGLDGIDCALEMGKFLAPALAYLTSYIDGKTLGRAALTRPSDFICKPFNERELIARLRLVLSKRKTGRAVWDASGLYQACRNGGPGEVREILRAGAEVDQRSPSGKTPLMHAAAFSSDPELVRVLLAAGADLNAVDQGGRSALVHALSNPHPAIAAALQP